MTLEISSKMKWLGYSSIIFGFAAVYFDQSALSVALPDIQREFNATEYELHWIINIYLLILSLFVLTGGRVADMIGMRRVFLTGGVVFSLASMACALAHSASELILFRAIQGIGSALLLPVSQGSIYHIFSDDQRGRALGLFGVSGATFLVIGPIIGGFFTQYVTWRWIFWINPILGFISFIGVFFILKDLDKDKVKGEKFDLLGFLCFCFAFAPLITAFMQAQVWGFGSTIIIVLFAITPLFFSLFLWIERKKKNALLDLGLYQNPNFGIGTFLLMGMQFTWVSTIFFAIFLQKSVGLSPFITGLALLPTLVMTPILSIPIGNWSNHIALKILIRIGFFLFMVAFGWLFFTSRTLNYGWIVIGFFIFGIATPFTALGTYRLMMKAAPKKQQGAAAGVTMFARQVGGAMGISLMSLAINYFLNQYQKPLGPKIAYAKGFSALLLIVLGVMALAFLATLKIKESSSPTLSEES